jgi:hypothetical protein
VKAPDRNSSAATLETADGTLSSDTPLAFTDDFDPHGDMEVDLRGRAWVRVDLPPGEAAYQVVLTVGIRQAAPIEHCVDFRKHEPRALKNPFTLDRAHFDVRGPDGASLHDARIIKLRETGLDLSRTLEAALPEPAIAAELLVGATVQAPTAEAFDAHGAVVATARGKVDGSGTMLLTLTGARPFVRVHVQSAPSAAVLERLCWQVVNASQPHVHMHAFDGLDEIGHITLAGAAGSIASGTLRADRITAVRIDGANAALANLCWTSVASEAARGWHPVPGVAQPIALPVQHPDYPARAGPIDLAGSEQVGLGRVRYGSSAPWAGQNFAELHKQLISLVDGGPGVPMPDPSRAARNIAAAGNPSTPGVAEPHLASLHPLDVALLVSMHVPLAQILGISLPDTSARPGVDYDYLVVADQADVGGGSPQRMLQHLAASGFVGVDAWICFSVRRSAAAPLAVPAAPLAYALPGGTFRAAGVVANAPDVAAGAIALDWDVSRTVTGRLAASEPVLHHVWRADEGNGQAPVAGAALKWLTKQIPLLVTSPASAPLAPPSYPSDWPQRSLRFVDPMLDEGWYGYRLSAVDLFGRFSGLSSFGAWWQWTPRPDPEPWYYVDPPADRIVHASAVRILDKVAPPPPAAVEAWALDPDDAHVVFDAAYNAWRETLPQAMRATLVGLRVRWRWLTLQQRQAPDVAEFRVYYNPGDMPPVRWPDVNVWQQRCFVSAYNANVTPGTGDRTYEVFLPFGGAGVFAAGVPLAPTLVDPIAYAQVTVTAADTTAHSADRWPGGGLWAGRAGNESRTAPPRQIFRVWRQKPDAPPPVVDAPRVYATPADWHGTRSTRSAGGRPSESACTCCARWTKRCSRPTGSASRATISRRM